MLLRCAFALVLLAGLSLRGECVESQATASPTQLQSDDDSDVERVALERALVSAAKENRRVLVVWHIGGGGSPESNLLDGALQKGEARRKLQFEYDVVRVDVGQFQRGTRLAKELGVDLSQRDAPPLLTVLDAQRKALASTDVHAWWKVDEKQVRKLDEKKLLEFLTQHQAPYVEAAKVRDAALARAKAEGKLVFLHFGAPWCGWCHKLEGWMEREQVAPLLARQFVDLKIDTDRMLGGGDMLKALRTSAGLKEDGGIPWFVFLDADGKVLATSEGPKGNVGFPSSDEEIAHFATMLETACKKLGAEDVAKIRDELLAVRREAEAKKKAK